MQVKLLKIFIIPLMAVTFCFSQAVDPCNQRLGKAMDVIDAQDKVIAAKTSELDAKNDLIESLKAQNKLLTDNNALLLKRNEDLSKLKCDKMIVFFGLLKHIRCK